MPDQMTSQITHSGFISKVADGRVKVSLFRPEACGSCQMKGYCGGDNDQREDFELSASGYELGDEVQLMMSTDTGLRAVVVAYIVPFFVLMISLITSLQLGLNEGIAALLSLLFTGLYFVTLKVMSGDLKQHFSIKIQKLQSHE